MQPKLITVLWLCSVLGWASPIAHASRWNAYPNIAEDRTESANFELRRLLCKSCGRVDDLVYIAERSTYFVSTDTGDVWQINQQGLLVDVFRGLGRVPDSGVRFDAAHYIDWVLTGEKSPKAYLEIVDGDALTTEAFDQTMHTAEQRVFEWNPGKGKSRYYLKTQQGWTALAVTREYDATAVRMFHGKHVVEHSAQSHTPIIEPPVVHLLDVAQSNYDIKQATNPLFMTNFRKQGRSRVGFMDINSMGWDGVYGTGYFHINHAEETLKFSAFHRILKGEDHRADIRIYQLSDSVKVTRSTAPPDLVFYGLYGRVKENYAEDEIGLYVLRPKLLLNDAAIMRAENQGIDFGRYRELNTTAIWQPRFDGFDAQSVWLRNLIYVNGREEDFGDSGKQRLVSHSRSAPLLMDFVFSLTDDQLKTIDYLHINQHFYFPKTSGKKIYLDVIFDERETLSALAQFGQGEDSLELVVSAEWLEQGVSLAIALRSTNKIIPLERARLTEASLSEAENRYGLRKQYEQDRVKQAFVRAQGSLTGLADFILLTTRAVANNDDNSALAFAMANYTTKLMIVGLQAGNAEATEQLFMHYVNVLYPRVGAHKKMFDVASMALVLGVTYNNANVTAATFELLGGQAFDMTTIDNEVLLYNLACYYARQNQTAELFQAAQLAVHYGKKVDQFLADSDFSAYSQNPEFLRVINGSP